MLSKPAEKKKKNQTALRFRITPYEWRSLRKQTIHADKDAGKGDADNLGVNQLGSTPKKLEKELPHNPSVPLLGVYPQASWSAYHGDL